MLGVLLVLRKLNLIQWEVTQLFSILVLPFLKKGKLNFAPKGQIYIKESES